MKKLLNKWFGWVDNPTCPNEGTDPRITRYWTCNLQNSLSTKSTWEPLGIMIGFPPFLAINIPLLGMTEYLSKRKNKPLKPWYLMFRIGWRYDKFWPGYIFPEVALKIMQSTVYY